MGTIKRMFELRLKQKEVIWSKRILASLMLPILIFYMTSMNLFTREMMAAHAEETTIKEEAAEEEASEDEAEEEETESGEEEEAETPEEEEEGEKELEEPTAYEPTEEEAIEEELADDGADVILEDDSADADGVAGDLEEEEGEGDAQTDLADVVPAEPVEIPAEIIPEEGIITPEAAETEASEEIAEEEIAEEVVESVLALKPVWESSENGKISTIGPVELDETYIAPQNDKVTVTFTKLPSNPGTLSIEEIKLSEKQKESIRAYSDIAYDITSDMEDGTFEYELTLPLPEGADRENFVVKYAENVEELSGAKSEEVLQNDLDVSDDQVKLELDHFTVFIIGPNGGANISGWTNPQNSMVSDGVYTTATSLGVGITAKGFGFNIPAEATINGIEVNVERFMTRSNNKRIIDSWASLFKNGAVVYENAYNRATGTDWKVSTTALMAEENKVYGSPTDTWGLALTPADVNNPNFGFHMQPYVYSVGTGIFTAYVDYIGIKIHYTLPDTTAPEIPALINPVNGAFVKPTGLILDWSDSIDPQGSNPVKYYYQSSYDSTVGINNALTSPIYTSQALTSSQIDASGSADHTYYWQVKACDSLDNCSDWSGPWTVTVDITRPVLTGYGISDTMLGSGENSFNLTGNISDATSPIDLVRYVIWDSSKTIVYSGWTQANAADGAYDSKNESTNHLINVSSFPDGDFVLEVRGLDKAGNVRSGGNFYFTIDRSVPTVDLIFPATGSSAKTFQAVFSEDVNESEAENPANYFLNNWPGAGGSGDLAGDATVSYDLATMTATITLINPGWYVSPEQKWGVENIHDLVGNLQAVNPYEETSTPMLAPTDPGIPVSVPNPTNLFTQDWTWLASTDIGGSGVKGYYRKVYDVFNSNIFSDWSWIGNVLGVSTNLTDGQYQLQLRAEDNAGNVGNEVSSATLIVDSAAPIITIDPSIATPTNRNIDTKDPDNVKNLDAEYDEENNEVKLTWDAEDSDIAEVLIYQGKSKGFSVNSNSRVAENDDSDESYTDDNIRRGDKYYYKLVTRDEAGNKSDVKIISISIPEEGGEAIVVDEGTEILPEGTVLGEVTPVGEDSKTEQGNGENEQVFGAETAGEISAESPQSENKSWPYWAGLGVLILVGGIWWWWARKKPLV